MAYTCALSHVLLQSLHLKYPYRRVVKSWNRCSPSSPETSRSASGFASPGLRPIFCVRNFPDLMSYVLLISKRLFFCEKSLCVSLIVVTHVAHMHITRYRSRSSHLILLSSLRLRSKALIRSCILAHYIAEIWIIAYAC